MYVGIGLTNKLVTTNYIYKNQKIPMEFDGYKILVISDLHCKNFGENQKVLISDIKSANANIIVILGDTVDEDHLKLDSIENLFKGIKDVAPIYHITGNHELELDSVAQYEQLKGLMEQYSIIDLDDQNVKLLIGNSYINLYGNKYYSSYIKEFIKIPSKSDFNILLYHGSDNFDSIVPFGYDLVLSGHAHGGIIRLPIIGGIIGNDGKYFPKYTKGMYKNNYTTLIPSCGLGDSNIPRFYNNPEIVVITLKNH